MEKQGAPTLPFIPKLGKAGGRENLSPTPLPCKPYSSTSSSPNPTLPPAFSLRKGDTSLQTQTGTDGHFVMQMRAPAQRTKLGPWGKGAGPFPADKSMEGGAMKRTLPLPHPQPALRRKSNRAERPGSGIPSLQLRHTYLPIS